MSEWKDLKDRANVALRLAETEDTYILSDREVLDDPEKHIDPEYRRMVENEVYQRTITRDALRHYASYLESILAS